MKPVRTHTLGGKRYEIIFASAVDGFVEWPGEPHVFFINDNDTPKNILETTVHEAAHAIDPRLGEKRVARLAAEMARLLWRLGYQRQQD